MSEPTWTERVDEATHLDDSERLYSLACQMAAALDAQDDEIERLKALLKVALPIVVTECAESGDESLADWIDDAKEATDAE